MPAFLLAALALGLPAAGLLISRVRHGHRVRVANQKRHETRRGEVARLIDAGKHVAAAELLEKMVAEMEQRLGLLTPELVWPLYTLGMVSAHCGRTDEAEAILRRALLLARRAPRAAPDGGSPAAVSLALGWLLASTDRFLEARPYYESALAEGDEAQRSMAEHGLGTVAQAAGALEEAERWYRRALVSLLAEGTPAGSASADVGPALASPYRVRPGDADAGETGTVDLRLTLGALAGRRGALEQAEDDFRQALAIEERRVGMHGAPLTRVLDPLARLLLTADRLPEASLAARRALELAADDALARAQAEALLGTVLCEADDLDAARALCAQAVTRFDALADPPARALCVALHAQGLCLLAARATEEAARVLSRGARVAAAEVEVRDGPSTPELELSAAFLNALAYAQCELGHLAEAERSCHRALESSRYDPRATRDEPRLANVIDTFAEIRRRQHCLPEARALAERALRAVSAEREDVSAGMLHGTLARVLRDEGKHDQARIEHERALAIVLGTRGRGWRWRKLEDDFGG